MSREIFIPNNIFKNLDNETINKLNQLDKNIIQELNQWIELDYKIETYKLLKGTPKTILKKVYSFYK